MTSNATIAFPLPEPFREAATDIYLEAFWTKLQVILGRDRAHAVRFFAPTARLDRAIAAVADDRLVGLAGFKDHEHGFLDADLSDLQQAYGWIGGLWRGLVLSILERPPRPDELLMDGIVVAPEARGQGVGTRLLDAIETLARERGASTIRLDVIDTNPDARRLYERRGFEPVRTESTGPLRFVFGFKAATQMRKTLAPNLDEMP